MLLAPSPQRQSRKHRAPVVPPKTQAEADLIESFSPSQLRWNNVDWIVLTWMVAMHIGAVAAFWYVTWPALAVALVLHWFTGSIGICLGYHRFLSHRSLKLKTPARFMTLLAGSLSGQGSPLIWAATHRLHHHKSDQQGDPHSPLDGPWWSHIMWLFAARKASDRELLLKKYVPDLLQDPMLQFFEKTYFLWQVGSGIVLYAIGGMPLMLWGLCFRACAMYHSTWFVNSATHIWGYRNYDTRDESRNLWWVAVLSYGEGWHNNHHAHPHLARAGHKWWEVDPTFMAIRTLQFLGLATHVDDRKPENRDASATAHAAPDAA